MILPPLSEKIKILANCEKTIVVLNEIYHPEILYNDDKGCI
jgi:hypothetical protein